MTGAGEPESTSRIEAVPLDVPFRPTRRTAVPVINGPQLATVIAQGDAVHPGRLKVRFHWAERTADQEVWLRATAVKPPPVPGSQVIVRFLEGDPNRPLITDVLGR
jgi:type VI secretion system secreted protein VgrG